MTLWKCSSLVLNIIIPWGASKIKQKTLRPRWASPPEILIFNWSRLGAAGFQASLVFTGSPDDYNEQSELRATGVELFVGRLAHLPDISSLNCILSPLGPFIILSKLSLVYMWLKNNLFSSRLLVLLAGWPHYWSCFITLRSTSRLDSKSLLTHSAVCTPTVSCVTRELVRKKSFGAPYQTYWIRIAF